MKGTSLSRHVMITVLPGSSLMTCSAIIDPLRAANRVSKQPLFSWEIVSMNQEPILLTCGIELPAKSVLAPQMKADLLIIIAGFDHERHTRTQQLINLKKASHNCQTVFGVEAGTWLLARAGVISNQKVTTHWEDLERLSEQFSSLKVSSQRYVVDEKFWTCSGAIPALEMMLHYLRTVQNQSLALDVAKVFIYAETSSASDEQANTSLSRLQQVEPRLAQMIRLMEAHIEDTLPIKKIAQIAGISLRTLEQLSRQYLSFTPGKYYLRLRLQTARRLVLDSNLPALEISVRCGFNSLSAFSRAFKARYNQSPLQLRKGANKAELI